VVVALVPILAFAVIVVLRLNHHEQDALKRATAESAHVLLTAVDRELARSLTSLDVLASSRQLDHGNMHAFYDDSIPLLNSHRVPADWVGGIVDAQGLVVARTRAADQSVGQPAGALVPVPEVPARAGWLEEVMVEGSRSYVTYMRSPFSGWTVSLAVPVVLVD